MSLEDLIQIHCRRQDWFVVVDFVDWKVGDLNEDVYNVQVTVS